MPQIDKFLLAHALTLGLDAPDQIEVIFRQGRQRVCVVFDGVGTRVEIPEPADKMEQAILAVLRELGPDETMTGEDIAAKCEPKYSYGGRFKSALSRLVKAELIFNHNPGYTIA